MNNIHASQVSLFYSLCTGSAGVKENICNIGTVLLVTMYSESNQLQEVSDHLINNSFKYQLDRFNTWQMSSRRVSFLQL